MLQNFLILLTLLSPLSSILNSNDFCKKNISCTQKNVPYIYECGQGICSTKNQTACKDYLKIEKLIKQIQFIDLFEQMRPGSWLHNEKRLTDEFKTFQS